jgi:hypothetical protein
LNPWGEYLALTQGSATLDGVSFGAQQPDISVGRFPDGLATFLEFPDSPSPGEPNYLPLAEIVLNEILAHTDPPLEDAIELVNQSAQPVDIGGWYLSDSTSSLRKYRIPDNTVLSPGGFKVFYEADFNGGPGSLAPFNLNSYRGDTVALSEADTSDTLTGYRSLVHFGPTANGIALGRTVTTVGTDFAPQIQPSFGVAHPGSLAEFRTGTGASNPGPRIGPVVIQEILATPPDLGDLDLPNARAEFLEIANAGSQPVALFDPANPQNTWRLDDAVQFDFPLNTVLAAGEELLIVGFDPDAEPNTLQAFRHRYDLSPATRILGPFAGRLADEGERVELLQPDAPQTTGPDAGLVPYVLIERVHYAASAPWPTEGIGLGASLQRLRPELYANDPAHWISEVPTPGFAAIDPAVDADQDGMPDPWERDYGLNPGTDLDAQTDLDGDGASNLAEYLAGTDPTSPLSVLRLLIGAEPLNTRHLTFRAAAGVPYSLQYRETLEPAVWTSLLELEPAYVGQWITITDPLPAALQRFYRLGTPGRQ